jgi:hypothetical protein
VVSEGRIKASVHRRINRVVAPMEIRKDDLEGLVEYDND